MIQSYARWGLVHNSFKWHQSMHDGAFAAQQQQMLRELSASVILVRTPTKKLSKVVHMWVCDVELKLGTNFRKSVLVEHNSKDGTKLSTMVHVVHNFKNRYKVRHALASNGQLF